MSTAELPQKYENFDLVKRVKLDYTDVTVSKWRSRVTGLNVVHLEYEGVSTLCIEFDRDILKVCGTIA